MHSPELVFAPRALGIAPRVGTGAAAEGRQSARERTAHQKLFLAAHSSDIFSAQRLGSEMTGALWVRRSGWI